MRVTVSSVATAAPAPAQITAVVAVAIIAVAKENIDVPIIRDVDAFIHLKWIQAPPAGQKYDIGRIFHRKQKAFASGVTAFFKAVALPAAPTVKLQINH